MRALFIEAVNGFETATWIGDLSDDMRERLRQMQAHVGGWIEAVSLDGGTMYINEEGKLRGLPFNWVATEVATVHGAIARNRDLIVGNAIVLGPTDDNGDDTAIPDDLKRHFYEVMGFGDEEDEA